jgi:hypothetical protein
VPASKTDWSSPSLKLLLDIVGNLPDSGSSAAALLAELRASEHQDVAERTELALE